MLDSHCHIGEAEYDDDRAEVIERARDAGVTHLVIVAAGGDLETNRRAIAACEGEPNFRAVVGIHPHFASAVDDAMIDAIRSLAADPAVVAIGETGLDFHYDHSPRDQQRTAFEAFIALAREVERPIVVHSRNAADETLDILRAAGNPPGVFHCFTYDRAVALRAVDLGMYVSFSGIVTFKNAEDVRDAARAVPVDRILVETDCPYLTPAPKRGGRNEPSRLPDVVRVIAEAQGLAIEEAAAHTLRNARQLFGF